MQKRLFVFGMLCLAFAATTVHAQGIDFDIHIGNRPAPQPPPPVVVDPPPVVVEAPPEMVYVEALRAYVAVGISHDLLFYDNVYYYHANGAWYRSPYYRGPWIRADYRGIPPGFRGRRIEEIREYRQHAWEDYRERGEHFKGRHFRAEEARERHDHERNQEHFKRKHRGDNDDD